MNKVKLHLGCGKKYLPEYIHIDKDTGEHIDYSVNINDLSMFSDNSVDEIYTCGTFEYFDREEAPSVLKEWFRVLKPNSVFRISVPNLESIVKVYIQSNQDADSRGILGPLFGRWPIVDSLNNEGGVYDFKSLSRVLEEAGFCNIEKYDSWEFLPNDFDDYSKAYIPHMDRNGIQMCLNLKCRRG